MEMVLAEIHGLTYAVIHRLAPFTNSQAIHNQVDQIIHHARHSRGAERGWVHKYNTVAATWVDAARPALVRKASPSDFQRMIEIAKAAESTGMSGRINVLTVDTIALLYFNHDIDNTRVLIDDLIGRTNNWRWSDLILERLGHTLSDPAVARRLNTATKATIRDHLDRIADRSLKELIERGLGQ